MDPLSLKKNKIKKKWQSATSSGKSKKIPDNIEKAINYTLPYIKGWNFFNYIFLRTSILAHGYVLIKKKRLN